MSAQPNYEQSEERFHLLVDGVKEYAIYMLDEDGHVTTWNAGAERIKGYKSEEIAGRHYSTFFTPEDRETGKPEQILATARKDGRYQGVGTRVRKDGSRFTADVVITALRGPDGDLRGFAKVTRDVTDRIEHELEVEDGIREEARALDTLNKVGKTIAAQLDLKDALQSVTDASTELAGADFGAFFYNVVDAQGEAYTLYTISGAPREAFAKFGMPRNTAIFGPTFSGENIVRLDDVTKDPRYGKNAPHRGVPKGHLPVKSYLAVPVRSMSGEVLGGLFFGHSRAGVFTERSERLVVGLASYATVAIDNAKLYQQRLELIEQLRDADRRKDQFLAILSHELRNPLAAISNAVELLSVDQVNHQEQARAILKRQVNQMARLVDDLLDLSRVTRGAVALDKRSVGLREVLDAALETSRPNFEAHRHTVTVETPATNIVVFADRLRLSQVVANILNNAAKYTPPGGVIKLSARVEVGNAIITVKDNGVGIPREMLGRVFDMFTQLDPDDLKRSDGGLGIGLALCKKLLELHDGSIEARSEGPGKGAEFIVSVPIIEAQPANAQSPGLSIRRSDNDRRRVLLVDDNVDAAQSLAIMLDVMGHEVRVAHDGESALAMAVAEPPDVIFLDLGMRGMNGYAVVQRIRKDVRLAHVRVVAITGYGLDSDRQRTRDAGFDEHLVKPASPDSVRAAISAA